jgi:hypothetical protein
MEGMMRSNCDDPIKLSVFVGSPKRDLEKVRQAIIQAILEAGHIPDGMELWASDARPTLKTIADKLRLCDVHVVVLGPRYGQILENETISFTEWEYRQSRDAKRPIISFLLEQEAFEAAWKKNPPSENEKTAYMRLWNELRSKSVCKLYPTIEMPKIDRDVLNALAQVIDAGQLRLLAGWIRAESKAAILTAALQGNPFLMRVMDRVVRFRTTGGRFEKERSAKKAAALMFWDTMMNQLARAGYMDIFLESGSSLAYVSEALESRLDRHQGWRIATNNALALLQMLLFTDGDIRRNPPVAPDPEDPYGAIFTMKCKQAYEEPQVKPRALYQQEKDAIQEIIELLKAEVDKQIILATASGWDTAHPVAAFHGPHVGSHANMLFKRAIFMTGEPVVLFLSRHKVDPKFREAAFKCRTDRERPEVGMRYCYPVFGEELPLESALVNTPLALCIGFEQEKDEHEEDIRHVGEKLKSILRPELEKAKFNLEYAAKEFIDDDGSQSGAILVANEKFQQLFPR